MPELPEVETVRRGLQPAMEGARFTHVEARRPDLRFPLPKDFVKRLEGQTVTGLGRRAKYLMADLSSGEVLIMHLGMSGSFHVSFDNEHPAKAPDPAPPLRGGRGAQASRREENSETLIGDFHYARGKLGGHDHVVFRMSSGATVTFNDPRRFGFMKLVERRKLDAEPMIASLGPEPLGNAFDAAALAAACNGKKTSIKAALLDQQIVAGLGNIYVCEALFRAGISPKRMASAVATRKGEPNERTEKLVAAIRDVLQDAIRQGGSSLRDHRRTDGELGYFQHHFRVYDREGEPCPGRCGGTIKRIVQSGRSTFYCPKCQK